MGRTLVTGGTGFVGSHIVRALRRRGDEVRVTVREGSPTEPLGTIEVERVSCDLRDRTAVRRAMRGVDRVYHAAGLVSLRPQDRDELFEVNVASARRVFEEALRAGVERVVHVSAAVAFGPAPPRSAVDEERIFDAGGLAIPYVNSKHESGIEAMRAAAQGLSVVVVNPTWALGPGDVRGSSTYLVERFMRGAIPAYSGGGLNVVDVRDVARGALLAERRGRVGERYILGGRNFTTDRLMTDLARMTGRPAPARVPSPLASTAIRAMDLAGLPSFATPEEVRMGSLWWTYRSAKARRELGWTSRPHEQTLEDTISWYSRRLEADAIGAQAGRASSAARVAARAAGLLSRPVKAIAERVR